MERMNITLVPGINMVVPALIGSDAKNIPTQLPFCLHKTGGWDVLTAKFVAGHCVVLGVSVF